MATYVLRREQFVPRPLEEVFAFFAQAENLDRVTPEWMHFHIVTPQPIVMRQGTRIEYRIRWGWLPMRWVSEITLWNPPFEFVDEQRRGPYKTWHHRHTFQAAPGGTLVGDTVRYSLPLGPLGRFMHWLMVRRDLDNLFAYRRQRIEELFGTAAIAEPAAAVG